MSDPFVHCRRAGNNVKMCPAFKRMRSEMAVVMYAQGMPSPEVAARLGFAGYHSVLKHVRDAGLPIHRKFKAKSCPV